MVERVRMMLWCTRCVTGLQLPAVRAVIDGLFAREGLAVELIPATPFPDLTLGGLAERVRAVDRGEADLAVTSVAYLLSTLADGPSRPRCRFVATLHERAPVAGIVLEGSDIEAPEQLAGRPTANWVLDWFVREYTSALADRGLGPARLVDATDSAYAASDLRSGAVDVVPAWSDTLPIVQEKVGAPVRAVEVDVDVYATGILAADRVPAEVVEGVRAAVACGYELMVADPEPAVEAFARWFPGTPVDEVRRGWRLFERSAARPPGEAMDATRWAKTIERTCRVHGLAVPPADHVFRPELAAA